MVDNNFFKNSKFFYGFDIENENYVENNDINNCTNNDTIDKNTGLEDLFLSAPVFKEQNIVSIIEKDEKNENKEIINGFLDEEKDVPIITTTLDCTLDNENGLTIIRRGSINEENIDNQKNLFETNNENQIIEKINNELNVTDDYSTTNLIIDEESKNTSSNNTLNELSFENFNNTNKNVHRKDIDFILDFNKDDRNNEDSNNRKLISSFSSKTLEVLPLHQPSIQQQLSPSSDFFFTQTFAPNLNNDKKTSQLFNDKKPLEEANNKTAYSSDTEIFDSFFSNLKKDEDKPQTTKDKVDDEEEKKNKNEDTHKEEFINENIENNNFENFIDKKKCSYLKPENLGQGSFDISFVNIFFNPDNFNKKESEIYNLIIKFVEYSLSVLFQINLEYCSEKERENICKLRFYISNIIYLNFKDYLSNFYDYNIKEVNKVSLQKYMIFFCIQPAFNLLREKFSFLKPIQQQQQLQQSPQHSETIPSTSITTNNYLLTSQPASFSVRSNSNATPSVGQKEVYNDLKQQPKKNNLLNQSEFNSLFDKDFFPQIKKRKI